MKYTNYKDLIVLIVDGILEKLTDNFPIKCKFTIPL